MRFLLHQLLTSSAAACGDRPAVIDGERTLTYRELDVRSGRLASLLLELGVRRGDRVGLCVPKSAESVVAVYGVLKAGAAYVPLDPGAPAARLAFIVRNCSIRVLLAGSGTPAARPELLRTCPDVRSLVLLDAGADASAVDGGAGVRVLPGSALDARAPADPVEAIGSDLAMLLYTSGSTGEPKGVMLSHRNVLTFVLWAAETFGLRPEDRLSNHAPLHFDLSTFDLFGAAAAGAAVVLVPPATSVFPVHVARFMGEQRISVWYSVPSVLSMLATRGGLEPGDLPALRAVLFAGEVFPTKYLRRLMELLPHARFVNLYGPTETNVCTWFDVPPLPADRTEPIPIGRAIDDVEVFAVDEHGRRVEPGEPGELLVRGPSVMQGYWGDADRTSRALVPNPLGGELRDHVYRTGDVAVLGEDGAFRLLGRRDAQIKTRGYRVELGEVEAALYAHPAVEECAVVALPDDLVTNRIHAFVVVRGEVTPAALAAFCAERIPGYMVPERFEFAMRLPRTSTGKVDRVALADLRPDPLTAAPADLVHTEKGAE